jgi:hypothetical protein
VRAAAPKTLVTALRVILLLPRPGGMTNRAVGGPGSSAPSRV